MGTFVEKSYSTSRVSAAGGNGGGFAGMLKQWFSKVTIADSYASGDVYCGANNCGGFFGESESSVNAIEVTNSYSANKVFGTNNVGGFAGRTDTTSLSDSFTTSIVSGSGSDIGGVVGNTSNDSTATRVSFYTDNNSLDCVAATNGSTFDCTKTLSDKNFKSPENFWFSSWDFTTPIWKFPEGGGLPVLN